MSGGTSAGNSAASNNLKKSIGRIIISINSEILELLAEYKKVKTGVPLSKKGEIKEESVKKKKEALEDALKNLESRAGYIEQEKMEKLVEMIKNNIITAVKALDGNNADSDDLETEVSGAQKKASETIEEIELSERQTEEELSVLADSLSNMAGADTVAHETVTVPDDEEEEFTRELRAVGKYQSDRVGNMLKSIKEKMDFHKSNLLGKWDSQKDLLDYQALKEIRSEMESTHKKLCYMVSEWDRRKLSDRISDHLMDTIGAKHDEYMQEYRKMEEEKRTEAAVQRKRNLELDEYKREKRRPIPSWPSSLPYSKFRPDLISWDKENHLSTGSVKFGLLAEMFKSQGRLTIYEQIQVRLGNNRTDADIINQVVALLDTINEETVYNKLSNAWDDVVNIKRTKGQSLNDFISKFETIQYSLNLADESFKEQVPVEAGKDRKYYEEREEIALRRIEMNDKLKAVQLIKALGVDGAFKRDILAKINFNKEPKKVYEETKTAIRDICGEKMEKIAANDEESAETNVHLVKPWQEDKHSTEGRNRYSRSQSWDRRGRDRYSRSKSNEGKSSRYERPRSREGRRERSFSRDRGADGSRERSSSRGRSRNSVSFRERSRRDRRDDTPGPGMSPVIQLNPGYKRIYLNDDFFKHKSIHLGQFMIVDCGSPRSIMGHKDYERLRNIYGTEKLKGKAERFKFGPSKIYTSKFKVKFPMKVGEALLEPEFFVIEADIPTLLGNDVMEPFGGNIDMDSKKLVLKKIKEEISLLKSPGGHFVIPMKAVAATQIQSEHVLEIEDSVNIRGSEAEAVMLSLLANAEDCDMETLHNEIGHAIFVSLALTDNEESQVKKVHRYFGHRSARRIWELFAKADKLKGKRKAVLDMIEKCKICAEMKKSPPRPKVGLPVANDFNEVVGLDLKVVDKTKGIYILWIVDLFSKLIKGKIIRDKNPSTIIESILTTWIIGDGAGPGHPSRGFWSDNGGEFLNNQLINFAAAFDINIKMTAAEAPWQNGVVERHHATADIVYEKLMLENPKMNSQEAVNQAAFSKNSEINQSRFSALQLMCGQSPQFPGLAEASPASSNLKSSNKYMKTLKNIDTARVKFREIDCDTRLKKVMSEKINPNVERPYNMGDPVFFYDMKRKEWKKGTALIRLGKTLYLRFGNFLRRVPVDKVRPDFNGEVSVEEGYAEHDHDQDRFTEEETPVKEMAKDLELAEENIKLKKELDDLKAKKEDEVSIDNPVLQEKKTSLLEVRKLKRKLQKEKKEKDKLKLPATGKIILFREKGSQDWITGKVIGSYKKTSIYKYWKHVMIGGLVIDKDFENGIEEWKEISEDEEEECDDISDTYMMVDDDASDVYREVFPVKIIPPKEYHRVEIQEAMQAEISKYKSFNAFEEVPDIGQTKVPIRWVVTEQKQDAKNAPFKARLCVRGDLEKGKENIRSDSPTASKETLKLALILAANEGFEVKSIDVKSAYLQGSPLDRKIYVLPPPEANVEGKLWLLRQGTYGVIDGGRLFYLRFSQELIELGMHKIHSDGALFTYVKDNKLQGFIASHVDDWLVAGNEVFEEDILSKLKGKFKFSKIETKSFEYLGCHIEMKNDGSIELDQNSYVDAITSLEEFDGGDDRNLTDKEKKAVRGKIGELLWISLMTRPDLSFDVNALSSEIANATVSTAKSINKIVKKAKHTRNILRFLALGDISTLRVKVYADASFCNQEGRTRSTGGRVVLLENKNTGLVNIVSWKTKKISRVCRSAKGAETRALDDAIDDAVNTARLVREIYNGNINLKSPEQIPVKALTDSKSLWDSLHNTRQCEEKLLRNSVAGIKELLDLKMVEEVDWVPTDQQLADCMTKKGKKAEWLLKVSKHNILSA